jgi:hypothetical protein
VLFGFWVIKITMNATQKSTNAKLQRRIHFTEDSPSLATRKTTAAQMDIAKKYICPEKKTVVKDAIMRSTKAIFS